MADDAVRWPLARGSCKNLRASVGRPVHGMLRGGHGVVVCTMSGQTPGHESLFDGGWYGMDHGFRTRDSSSPTGDAVRRGAGL